MHNTCDDYQLSGDKGFIFEIEIRTAMSFIDNMDY